MTKGDIGYLVMDVDASASQEALDMLHEVEGTIRVRVLFLIQTVNLKATALSVAFYRYLHYHVKSIPIDQIIKCQFKPEIPASCFGLSYSCHVKCPK